MSKLKKSGLILSRKRGETVLIGADIEVTVAEIRNNVVKLHFAGPLDTVILRKELVQLEEVQQ